MSKETSTTTLGEKFALRFRAISEHDSGYSDLDIRETLSILSSEIRIMRSRDIESKQGETPGKRPVQLTI